MGNTAYLCCSNFEGIYPSVGYQRFRPKVHTLASARQCIPVLWLALFDPDDLRTAVLPADDGGEVEERAPLARKVDALARFDKAVARIEKAYPRIGTLSAHAAAFRSLLKSARGKLITIELDEIASLARSRRGFDKRLRKALDYLSGANISRISRTLTSLSGLDPNRRLIPPKELFARSRPLKADLLQCMRAVGTSFMRDVPWEHAPKKPRKQRAPKLHEQLHSALEAGNEKLARDLLDRGASTNDMFTLGARANLPRRHDTIQGGALRRVSYTQRAASGSVRQLPYSGERERRATASRDSSICWESTGKRVAKPCVAVQ